MLWLRLPLVPVIVNVEAPFGVFLEVFTVSVDEPLPFTDVGLNVALVREGSPVTLNVTVPLKPFVGVTVTA